MKAIRKALSLGMAGLMALSGCVSPGDVDVNDVYRLQQAMLARSPQDRSEEGLGLMRPVSHVVGDVPVDRDPDTGVERVKLSIRDVLVRALANNPDIAVVSFSPAIAREQAIQAAAEFDYTVFGSIGYNSSDTARDDKDPIFGQGVQKNRNFQAGVRQKTVTGAEWSLSNTMVRSWDDQTVAGLNKWYTDDLAFQITQPLLRNAWPDVNLAGVRIARLNHKISMSQFRQQVETTITQTLVAYYQLIQAKGNVEIARKLLADTIDTHDKVKLRQDLDATKVEIQQSLAAVKFREGVLVAAEKTAGDVQDQLVRLLADPQLNLLEKLDVIPTHKLTEAPVQIDADDQLLTAIRLNPALEQARYAIRQAAITERAAKWNRLPELNITGGVSLNGGSPSSRKTVWNDLVSGNYVSYEGAITFELPIGNRLREAQYAQARFEHYQVIAQMQTTADQLAQQIRERIRAIHTNYKNLAIQKQALQASREQLSGLEDLEEIRGKLTPEFLNLKLNAQADVASAEQNVLAAEVDYNTAMLQLEQVTGSVLEMNQIKMVLPEVSQMPDQTGMHTTPAPEPAPEPGDDAVAPEPAGAQSSRLDAFQRVSADRASAQARVAGNPLSDDLAGPQ